MIAFPAGLCTNRLLCVVYETAAGRGCWPVLPACAAGQVAVVRKQCRWHPGAGYGGGATWPAAALLACRWVGCRADAPKPPSDKES